METITVDLGQRSYDIIIGVGLLDQLGTRLQKIVPAGRTCLVSDDTVFNLYGDKALRSLEQAGFTVSTFTFPPGDPSKSLSTAERAYDVLYDAEIDRFSPVVALGGGVVGDLTGFVAGTWLRGVPFVQVGTTLEAAIDASVGGKTAVNHPRGKNLIGVFHQPRMVLLDPDVFGTLDIRDVRAGLAESIKHGIISDADFFTFHETHTDAILQLDPTITEQLLARNCRIKAGVVSADEREAGLRAILNFGHTVGHAIEIGRGHGFYRHGEAVAMGMVAAGLIAVERKSFDEKDFQRLERLIDAFGLPTRDAELDADQLAELMKRDKKAKAGRLRFVLPTRIGSVEIVDDVPAERVAESIAYLKG